MCGYHFELDVANSQAVRNELSLYSMGQGHSRPFGMGVVELKSFCSEKVIVEGEQPY